MGALDSVSDVRRLLQIAVMDTLGLENSIARSRTLAYLAMTVLKTIEVSELENRIQEFEQALPRRGDWMLRHLTSTWTRWRASTPNRETLVMSKAKQRLDRIEEALPPREAVLLWMEDAFKCGSLVDMAKAEALISVEEKQSALKLVERLL